MTSNDYIKTGGEDMPTLRKRLVNTLGHNKGFILFLIVLFSAKWSIADHYRVPTGSMLPTIAIGDQVLTDKLAYDIRFPFTDIILAETGTPERGDIIVFKYPKDPSENYVKRLIAVPGDRVEILDGFVKVNGQLTLESPAGFKATLDKLRTSDRPFFYQERLDGKEFTVQRIPGLSQNHRIAFTVPKDQYFFMGDNRDNSADSRFWGFVPRNYLLGKVKGVTLSYTLDGLIPRINLCRFGKSLV